MTDNINMLNNNSGRFSPTSNQLAKWFSTFDNNKMPTIGQGMGVLSLEEFEKGIHNT
jgi:hypothetical protein